VKEEGREQENAVMSKSPSRPKRRKPKKQTEPSPRRPNKKRAWRMENGNVKINAKEKTNSQLAEHPHNRIVICARNPKNF
jgi:hypothetical protein